MKKINIILIAILAVQIVIWTFLPARSAVFGAKKVSIVSDIDSKSVARIVISKPGTKDKVTLVKNGKKWQIAEAYNFDADQTKIYEILAVIPNLKSAQVASTNKAMFTNYGLGDKPEWELVFSDAGNKELVNIFVGKSLVKGTFVRPKNENKVFRISGSLSTNLYSHARDFFEDTNMKLPPVKDRETITVNFNGGTIVLKKTKTGGPSIGMDGQMTNIQDEWSLMNETNQIDPTGDATKIRDFVSNFDSINFEGVEGTTPSPAMGLTNPYLTVIVTGTGEVSKKAVSLTIKIGSIKEGNKSKARYASISNSEFIYLLDPITFEKWTTKRSDLIGKPPQTPEEDLNKKIGDMKIPEAKLDLKNPVPDPMDAEKAIIRPAAPQTPVMAPAPPAAPVMAGK